VHTTSIAIEHVTPLTRVSRAVPPVAERGLCVARLHRTLAVSLVTASITLAGLAAFVEAERRAIAPLPAVREVRLQDLYFDRRPVPLTVTAAATKVPHVATRDEVRSDPFLWRRMRVDDWDAVPASIRAEAFEAMLQRYADVLTAPSAWDRMSAADWDEIPQPIRVMAFRHMAEYWSGYYQVGSAYGIPRRTMADTLSALLMSESWFEHRAVNENRWGNRDLGLAQASDATRERMVVLFHAGVVDVLFADDDYFDPWKATRFVAVWMDLLLDEVYGDLDLAVGAYHRGSARAGDRRGREYLAMVKQRLRRFVRNEGGPAAWSDLWHRDLAAVSQVRPWLSVPGLHIVVRPDDHAGLETGPAATVSSGGV
jgi:hypothetical protein